MSLEAKRNIVGMVGFTALCLGAGMAWMPAGFIVGGALLLSFSIIGIIRGN